MHGSHKFPSPPGKAAGAPIRSRLVTGLLLVFCCWHGAFLAYSIIPVPNGNDVPSHSILDFYRLAVSGSQQWNMFDTIPTLHSMDARLVGEDETGNQITRGCILPGFEPYPKPEQARYYVALFRLLSQESYRDAYLRNAAQLLSTQQAQDGKNWSLVVNAEYTRHLFHIQRDGHLAQPASKAFPLPVDSENSP
jgi:hypothetical protein